MNKTKLFCIKCNTELVAVPMVAKYDQVERDISVMRCPACDVHKRESKKDANK